MQTFNTGEYGNFSNASNSVFSKVSELNVYLKVGQSLIEKLNDENTFKGPICDLVVENWNVINKDLTNEANSLKGSSSFLNSASNSYKSSDNKNASEIGGV